MSVPPPFFDLFSSYFASTPEPSLADFVSKHEHTIVSYYQKHEKLDEVWKTRYSKAFTFYYKDTGRESRPPKKTCNADWGAVALSILKDASRDAADSSSSNRASNATPCASTTTSTTTTTTESLISITSTFLEGFRTTYGSMKPEHKWVLTSGKIVEDVIFSFGMKCQYEHAAHSFILDLSDEELRQQFTKEEIQEICRLHAHPLPPISEQLLAYLNDFKGLTSVEALEKRVRKRVYDFHTEFELDWAQHSIQNVLRLFHAKYFPITDQSEADLLRRVWGFVETAFDDTEICVRMGEKESAASSARRNSLRKPGTRKMHGHRTDILFRCMEGEIGCSEVGRRDGGDGDSKELRELRLKVPKMMKDMMWQLGKELQENHEQLAIVGFVMMGLKLRVLVLDRPSTYICRTLQTRPFFFPTTEETIASQLGALIGVVSQVKQLARSTLQVIRAPRPIESSVLEDPNIEQDELPPCPTSPSRKTRP